jgi:hypothetical protein
MDLIGWIILAIVLLLVVAVALWAMRRRRTAQLRERFGPEYDRAVSESGGERGARADLRAREQRREQLDIRPLSPEQREQYGTAWREVQATFVDGPSGAVRGADLLVVRVMQDRGYPMEEFEQRAADVSVDHPEVVDNYRAAHAISMANEQRTASTEDLRQAMVHYRALFQDLLGEQGPDPQEQARRKPWNDKRAVS